MTPSSQSDASTERLPLTHRPLFNKILLTIVAVMWGLSFVVMKDLVNKMPVFWLLAERFILTSIVLMLIVLLVSRDSLRDRRLLKLGLLLGLTNFAAYAIQTVGLSITTAGKNSFFSMCYCVMTPFAMWIVARQRPTLRHVGAALMCMAGVGLIALDGVVGFNLGDALSLVSAACYALMYSCVAKWGEGVDVLGVTAVEFAVMGIASTVCALIFAPGYTPGMLEPADLGAMAFLVLICSCFNFCALNHAMTYVDPSEGAILVALEAPFGVMSAVLFFGEVLTLKVVAGFALIFGAVVVSETGNEPQEQEPDASVELANS